MSDRAPSAGRLAASFRDPSGRLCRLDDRIVRIVGTGGLDDFQAFLASPVAATWMKSGRIVGTTKLDGEAVRRLRDESAELATIIDETAGALVVEHEAIRFASYPHEWPAEMLREAGSLTLELARALLPHGLGLKDATPYNVLFRGPHAVFVDVLSVERRDTGDSRWLPYAQFVRTFLLPLLLRQRFGLPSSDLFFTRRDGVEPEEAARIFGPIRKWLPPALTLATLPARLGKGADEGRGARHTPAESNPEKATFVLQSLLSQLSRTLTRLTPGQTESHWSDYMETRTHYSQADQAAKTAFVERVASSRRPKWALDVGCNTGHFSELVARSGASVVAIDADAAVVGSAWRRAHERQLDVLPLVVNLARPTPAIGWLNKEYSSFLARARGRFDLIVMLAVLHHLLVTERIPLDEVVGLASSMTSDLAIIEYVGPEDVMFRKLARGRDHLFLHLTREVFEHACRRRFAVVTSERLPESDRWLYLLQKRAAAAVDA